MSTAFLRSDHQSGPSPIIRNGSIKAASAMSRPIPFELELELEPELELKPDRELDRALLLRNGIFGFEHYDNRSRPFAMLRSQIFRRLDRMGGRIVAVTSTQPGNGKSFVAANLAAALSQIHPVWLIDLDLRRPCVGDRFGLPPSEGVDDYLLGEGPIDARAYHTGESLITILPVTEPRANSAEILSSKRATELFATLRERDGAPICIIDTPPIFEGDDMMIIASRVDAILLVIEEGRTRQTDLSDSLRMLQPTPIIGTVLNRTIFPKSGSAYDKNYAR